MNVPLDRAYQARFTDGLVKLMIDISLTETVDGQRIAMVQTAEIVDAMLTHIAVLMADSEATSTNSRTREFCDDLARKLQRRVNQAKQHESPFDAVFNGGPQ